MALLEPLETNEKNLIKLDAVFRALKIENEQDIQVMAQFFIDHVKRNEERVYVSSGVGPDEIDSEVKFSRISNDKSTKVLSFSFRMVKNKEIHQD